MYSLTLSHSFPGQVFHPQNLNHLTPGHCEPHSLILSSDPVCILPPQHVGSWLPSISQDIECAQNPQHPVLLTTLLLLGDFNVTHTRLFCGQSVGVVHPIGRKGGFCLWHSPQSVLKGSVVMESQDTPLIICLLHLCILFFPLIISLFLFLSDQGLPQVKLCVLGSMQVQVLCVQGTLKGNRNSFPLC